jgi:beta-xylosidase
VIDTAFADPAVLVDGNTFWAYGTNDNAINIQVAQSDDLVQWSSPQEALPALPAWANPAFGHVWAPDLFKTQQGKYIMYFSARHATAAKQCVGVAVASSPAGPFVSQAASPLVCQLSLGGTIDASSYVADGRRYLLYKNDGNCCGIPTSIYARPLAADGLGFTGPEMPLIKRDLAWEGSLIEGPSAIVHDKAVMLMYSANNWHSVQYAVGLAQSTSPSGPFTKRQKPWIVSGDGDLIGPGGQASFTVPGHGDYMALHGWDSKAMRYRAMYIAPVIWTADGPSLRY